MLTTIKSLYEKYSMHAKIGTIAATATADPAHWIRTIINSVVALLS